MALLIEYTLVYFAVLVLVALGGMFSERSGIINIGLEGIMVFGALGGALTMNMLPEGTAPVLVVLITIVASLLAGIASSMLLGIASIKFKADQTLIGTAINMIATAAATVITKLYTLNSEKYSFKAIPQLLYIDSQKYFVMSIGDPEKPFMNISWFVIIAFAVVAISYIVLYKTKFGLRLMACGEHPQAADSVGINVHKMRYAGVIISGALGGLGGLTCIAAVNSSWYFDAGVAGMGFLALAVMIFGQWKPIKIALAALLFGLFQSLSKVYVGIDFLKDLGISGTIYNMLPYIVSLIVLAFTSKKSRAPKAEGIPYDKGQR